MKTQIKFFILQIFLSTIYNTLLNNNNLKSSSHSNNKNSELTEKEKHNTIISQNYLESENKIFEQTKPQEKIIVKQK
jgi:hypothetical protein